MPKPLESLIAVALGERPAELVIKNARVWNAFCGEFLSADVAIHQGYIAAVGEFQGEREIDAAGKYLIPGFIDAHVHLESAMTTPAEFARALLRAGVTTVIADPHEIANVAGIKGLEYMLAATEGIPLNVYVMLPSCVPATPLENSGATLTADDLAPFLQHPRVLGLGEMMNFPGVLHRDPEVMRKLRMAEKVWLDGHSPGLSGRELSAYAAAGLSSSHECVEAGEASEYLKNGIVLMLRQGSAAPNLLDLLPAVTPASESWCMFATDDRNPHDLLVQGSINHMARLALEAGQPLARVLNMACLNAARHYGLRDRGAIAPGFCADLALYPDLTSWRPELVIKGGKVALHHGQEYWTYSRADDSALRGSVRIQEISPAKLALPAKGATARVIGVLPGQLLTEELHRAVPVRDGCFVADAATGVAKLSVWERYTGSGRVGVGLVENLGLKRGAIGSTVGHDSHHLIIAGFTDEDMLAIAEHLAAIGGGLALADGGRVIGSLPLPIGGILSDLPLERLSESLSRLQEQARTLGVPADRDPFMSLAFLSLPVIPSLKLTYAGLVDVTSFSFVGIDAPGNSIASRAPRAGKGGQ